MKRTLVTAVLCLISAVAIASCGSDDGGANEPAAETAESTDAATTTDTAQANKESPRGSSVNVMNSRYGRMLFDGRGQALYLFTRERTTRSRCYGECARAWPPFLTKGRPRARRGVKSSLLGTTRRRDGKLQVTYGGHPLYYYVDDGPGQVLCQDVDEFGGTWLVVSPNGTAIQ